MGILLLLNLYGAVRASRARARTELEWYQSEGCRRRHRKLNTILKYNYRGDSMLTCYSLRRRVFVFVLFINFYWCIFDSINSNVWPSIIKPRPQPNICSKAPNYAETSYLWNQLKDLKCIFFFLLYQIIILTVNIFISVMLLVHVPGEAQALPPSPSYLNNTMKKREPYKIKFFFSKPQQNSRQMSKSRELRDFTRKSCCQICDFNRKKIVTNFNT